MNIVRHFIITLHQTHVDNGDTSNHRFTFIMYMYSYVFKETMLEAQFHFLLHMVCLDYGV